jgi:hypothetical protein
MLYRGIVTPYQYPTMPIRAAVHHSLDPSASSSRAWGVFQHGIICTTVYLTPEVFVSYVSSMSPLCSSLILSGAKDDLAFADFAASHTPVRSESVTINRVQHTGAL